MNKELFGLRLEFQLVEDTSSVCRICGERVRDKPLTQLDVFKTVANRAAPTMVCTAFYCFDCYGFVYSQRKLLPFRPPSFLSLVYNLPTVVETERIDGRPLFNLLKALCPADALKAYLDERGLKSSF